LRLLIYKRIMQISLFPFIFLKRRSYERLTREKNLLASLVRVNSTPILRSTQDNFSAACIIFSMDRAPQLHALLGSYFEKAKNSVPIHVLYRASDAQHQKVYEEVFSLFENHPVFSIKQTSRGSFKPQLLLLLESIKSDKVFFLTDDDLFIDDVDLLDITKFETRTKIFSLRMGAHLTKSYPVQKEQKLPPFISGVFEDSDKLCWLWENGEYDWAYPLSVNGHFFSTQEFLALVKNTEFTSPNTLEANLQPYAKYFQHRFGICYKRSKILNIPINAVQNDNNNIHGTIHQNYLLEQWNRGMQMNYRTLYGLVNESAHQEVKITFIKRT